MKHTQTSDASVRLSRSHYSPLCGASHHQGFFSLRRLVLMCDEPITHKPVAMYNTLDTENSNPWRSPCL